MLGILEFAPLYILSTYFALKFGLGWAAALCSSGRRGGPAVPELCAARRVFARRLSAAATARAAPTPLRQLLTAPPSTWRTSTARAGSVASLHSPRLGGLGRVSGGRQGPVCSVRFHVEWGRLLASQWRGRALHCRGGRLPPLQSRTTALQARRGRRREEEGGSLAQPRSCFLPAAAIAKAANCALQSHSMDQIQATATNTDSDAKANTDICTNKYRPVTNLQVVHLVITAVLDDQAGEVERPASASN